MSDDYASVNPPLESDQTHEEYYVDHEALAKWLVKEFDLSQERLRQHYKRYQLRG